MTSRAYMYNNLVFLWTPYVTGKHKKIIQTFPPYSHFRLDSSIMEYLDGWIFYMLSQLSGVYSVAVSIHWPNWVGRLENFSIGFAAWNGNPCAAHGNVYIYSSKGYFLE